MLVDINTSKTSIRYQPDYSVSSLYLSDLQVVKSLIRFSNVWVKFSFNSARWQRRLHVSASRSCQGQKHKQYLEEKTSKAICFDFQASITLHVLFAEKEQEWIVKESTNNKSREKVSLGNLIFSCCAFILYPMFQKI